MWAAHVSGSQPMLSRVRCGMRARCGILGWLGPRAYATEAPLAWWFRAVDEPVSKPRRFAYTPARPPSKFEAFPERDSQRIEAAYARGSPSVLVETDGLMSVHLASRTCAPTYYDGPAYAVRRALWFEQAVSNKIALPEEALERALEAEYRADPAATAFALDVPVDPAHSGSKPRRFTGSFEPLADGSVRAVLQESDSWLPVFTKRAFVRGARSAEQPVQPPASQHRLKTTVQTTAAKASVAAAKAARSTAAKTADTVSRASSATAPRNKTSNESSDDGNIKHFNARPPYNPREIQHLIFCIHGIGQLLSLRYEQVNFVNDVDQLRRGLNRAYESTKAPAANNGIQVLPVMWRHDLDDTVNGLHPQQLFGSVNVAADVVLDFVMYMETQHRRRILETAANEMHRMYTLFCDKNPHFAANPKVSILGHSLGSVIAHDLVVDHDSELPFDVTNVFTMGSPLGILELMRHAETVSKGRAANLYNILRRADPVAARLEPIVTHDALKVAPRPLPGGGTNLLKQLRDFSEEISVQSGALSTRAISMWNSMLAHVTAGTLDTKQEVQANESWKTTTPEDAVDLTPLKHFNRHGRLDFTVQETMDISLVLGLAGHLMYLDNEDVAAFVLRETLQQ